MDGYQDRIRLTALLFDTLIVGFARLLRKQEMRKVRAIKVKWKETDSLSAYRHFGFIAYTSFVRVMQLADILISKIRF